MTIPVTIICYCEGEVELDMMLIINKEELLYASATRKRNNNEKIFPIG